MHEIWSLFAKSENKKTFSLWTSLTALSYLYTHQGKTKCLRQEQPATQAGGLLK